MNTKYFQLHDDLYLEGRWHLNGLRDDAEVKLDAREFTYGNYIDPGPPLKCFLWNEDKIVETIAPLRVSWSREGSPLDFTFADSGMPIVITRVADILVEVAGADIQRFALKIDRLEQTYEIINVIARVNCIDTKRSEIKWFEEGNKVRRDLAGSPELITKLVIDAGQVGEHHVFRLQGWELAIVVSDVVKQALEKAKVTGIKFKEV